MPSLSSFFLYAYLQLFGGLLLSFVGIWIIFQSFSSSSDLAKIINNPSISGFDTSQTLDVRETVCLALAMTCDSLFCGIGFSMTHDEWIIFPFLVALFQFIFLNSGMFLGKKIKSISSISSTFFSRLAGSTLILIGIIKMFM